MLILVILSCNSRGSQDKSSLGTLSELSDSTRLVFNKTMHDFGDIKEGEEIGCSFGFSNAGENPLLIQEVIAGCGCTNVKFPKHPIPPGQTGVIEIVFDTRGRKGLQRKTIRVISNGGQYPSELVIRANVE